MWGGSEAEGAAANTLLGEEPKAADGVYRDELLDHAGR